MRPAHADGMCIKHNPEFIPFEQCRATTIKGSRCARNGKMDGYCATHARQHTHNVPARIPSEMMVNNQLACEYCTQYPQYLVGHMYREQFYTLLLCLKKAKLPFSRDLRPILFDFLKPKMYLRVRGRDVESVHMAEHNNE